MLDLREDMESSQEAGEEELLEIDALLESDYNVQSVPNGVQSKNDKNTGFMGRSKDGVVIIQDQVIKYANDRFAQMLGYDEQELIGRGFVELIPPESISNLNSPADFSEVASGMEDPSEWKLLTKELKQLAVEINTCPIQYDGKSADMILIQDATESKIMESELIKKNRELKLKSERVVEATQLKSQFLANMSGELRTPVKSILKTLKGSLVGKSALSSYPESENLNMAIKDCYYLLNLINNITQLSKLQTGNLQLTREQFDLRKVLSKMITRLKPQIDKKGLNFEYIMPTKLPNINGDKDKIRQMLFNLLSNAVKFTERGSVGIVFEHFEDKNILKIIVWDTGIGIPNENKTSIFDEVWQTGRLNDKKLSGTGLSLAISKYIAELHGGKIWVEDNPGNGSRFYITIPISKNTSS
jgi:PAS domain S-box-containing protein